jgi:hypothetical protein
MGKSYRKINKEQQYKNKKAERERSKKNKKQK